MEKVKLMCSYGGKIQLRPHDLQLSYYGGHTKILTVDRNINFSNLLSKLHSLCELHSQIQLKYKMPGEDFDALISVFDDDDVDSMMFEYDLLRRISDKPPRLRLFLFFPATATATPVAPRSLNPDFLFGFDEEFSSNYATSKITEYTGLDTGDGAPSLGIWARGLVSGDYVYPAPLVYRLPAAAGEYFQAGPHSGMQTLVGSNMGLPEKPVVNNFVPVMPFVVDYGATKKEPVHPTVKMEATSDHQSSVSLGAQMDA